LANRSAGGRANALRPFLFLIPRNTFITLPKIDYQKSVVYCERRSAPMQFNDREATEMRAAIDAALSRVGKKVPYQGFLRANLFIEATRYARDGSQNQEIRSGLTQCVRRAASNAGFTNSECAALIEECIVAVVSYRDTCKIAMDKREVEEERLSPEKEFEVSLFVRNLVGW